MKNPTNHAVRQPTAKTIRLLHMPRLTLTALLLGLWALAPSLYAQKPLTPCAVTQTILYSNSVYSGPTGEWLESEDFSFRPTPGHFMTIVNTNYVSVPATLGGIPLNPSMPTGATNLNVSINGKRLQTKLDLSTNAANWYISITWIAWNDSCSSCIGQGATAENNSVDVAVRLGTDNFGRSSGQLLLQFETPTNLLAQPAGLQAQLSEGVEAVTNAGVLRQVRTPQMLADIVTNAAYSYTVSYYHTNAFGTTKVDGLYPTTAGSYLSVAISDPDGGTNGNQRLRVLQTGDLGTQQYDYVWSDSPPGWTLTSGSGGDQRHEVRTKVWNNDICMATNELRDASDNVVFKKIETFQAFPSWGVTNLIQQVIGPDTALPQTTAWTYCTNAADPNYRQLTLVTRPDGSWEKRDYDACSRVIRKMTPFGDSPSAAASNECRMTEFYYADEATKRWTMETDFVLGIEVGRRFHVVNGDITWAVVCTTNGVGYYTNANTLATVITHSADTNAAYAAYGAPLSIQHSDGTLSVFSYNFSGDGLTKTNTEWRGAPNSNHTSVTNGTCTVTAFNLAGQVIYRKDWDIASGLQLGGSAATAFDELGRPTHIDYADGTYETFSYGCCGLENQTDREGVEIANTYDSLRRQVTTTRAGVTTSNAYDAADRVIATFRNGVRMVAGGFDTAGRQLAATNALGFATTFSEGLDGGLIKTNVFPDGTTQIEASFRDRQLKSTTGNGIHGVRYDYGVASGSGAERTFAKKIMLLTNGTDSAEWTLTYSDMAGRPIKTIRADSNVVEQASFNSLGQLEWQKDGDGVTTIFAYNARGERVISAVSMNQAATINYSADRIVSNANVVLATDLGITRRAETWVYTEGAPVCVESHEAGVESLAVRTSAFGLTNLTTMAIDHNAARRTVTNTAPDGSFSVSVFESGRPISATRKDASGVQLEDKSFQYDAAGRLVTNVDARLGATVTTFDDADQKLSESQGGQTRFFDHNVMGRVTTNTLPDGAKVFTEYLPTGETNRTWGARVYPASYGWDYAGRWISLTTWTNFNGGSGSTGAATTRWLFDPQSGFQTGKVYPDNTTNLYAYSAGGRPLTNISARGVVTSIGYDASGLPTNTVYSGAATGAVTVVFDRRGRRTSVTDGVGAHIFTYNDAGQILTESFPVAGLTVTNIYDTLLRRTNLTAAGTTQIFGYDTVSRFKTVGFGNNTVTYEYLTNSALVAGLTFSNGLIAPLKSTRQYDGLNRLTNITALAVSPTSTNQSVANSFTYQYNAANQRTRNTFADGSYWEYGFDGLGQVTNATRYWASSSVVTGQQFKYAFDDIGNRTNATVNGRTVNYTANILNQYTQRTVPGALDILGSANPDGSVTVNGESVTRQGAYYHKEIAVTNAAAAVWQPIEVVGVLTNITVTNSGHLFLPQTPEAFTFDFDGNQTSDGHWIYTWDGQNRLIAMETRTDLPGDVPRQRLEFQYDFQWRRVRKQVFSWISGSWVQVSDVRFIYDGWNMIAEIRADNSVARSYVWGLDLSGSIQGAGGVGGLLAMNAGTNGTHFVACDGNGNVVGLYKSNDAAITAVFEYDPFGYTLRATGPMAGEMPIRFSTKYQDKETGHYYYGFRYFNGLCWLSMDPLYENGSLNLFNIAGNDLISGQDFLGLMELKFINCNDKTNAISTKWKILGMNLRKAFAALGRNNIHEIQDNPSIKANLHKFYLIDIENNSETEINRAIIPIRNMIKRMLDRYDSTDEIEVMCDTICDEKGNTTYNTYGASVKKPFFGGLPRIILYDRAFIGGEALLDTLTHELSHIYANTADKGYNDAKTGGTEYDKPRSKDLMNLRKIQLTKDNLLINADTLMGFIDAFKKFPDSD